MLFHTVLLLQKHDLDVGVIPPWLSLTGTDSEIHEETPGSARQGKGTKTEQGRQQAIHSQRPLAAGPQGGGTTGQ